MKRLSYILYAGINNRSTGALISDDNIFLYLHANSIVVCVKRSEERITSRACSTYTFDVLRVHHNTSVISYYEQLRQRSSIVDGLMVGKDDCPSVRMFVRLYVCPSVGPSVRRSVRTSDRPSIHPFVSSSVRLPVRPSIRFIRSSIVLRPSV